MSQLLQTAVPNFPAAPAEFTRGYQDQFINALRLYLTRTNNSINSVIGTNGGQYVDCPNGLFFDLDDHSPALANTGYPLEFKQTYLSNAVSVVDDTKITVAVGGIYNFQYSSALTSTDSSLKTVWVWIVRNGDPVGYTTKSYTVSGSGTETIVSWNFNIDLGVGEFIEMYWGADSTNVSMKTTAPTPPHTGVPSNVVAVNFIAPLPDPRPTPP